MKLSKVRILSISVLLLSTMTIYVLAYEYYWRTPNYTIQSGIAIRTVPEAEMGLGFYWDSGCTEPVTYIDFGEMIQPNSQVELHRYIYIRNEGNVTHHIRWNSTLNQVTTEITERWFYTPYSSDSINNTSIAVGTIRYTGYKITVPAYVTITEYNWTLTIWADYYY